MLQNLPILFLKDSVADVFLHIFKKIQEIFFPELFSIAAPIVCHRRGNVLKKTPAQMQRATYRKMGGGGGGALQQ